LALLSESRSLAEGIGFREGIAWSAEQLGLLAADCGDTAAAIPLLRRSLELHADLRDRWHTASVLEDLAAIALSGDDAARAARLLGAAETIREEIGTVIPACERQQHESTTAGALAALGASAFAAGRQRGRLASVADLRAVLDEEQHGQTAQEHGIDVEGVGRKDALGLGVQERPPGLPGPPGRGIDARVLEDPRQTTR
jgi:hypothetical protein